MIGMSKIIAIALTGIVWSFAGSGARVQAQDFNSELTVGASPALRGPLQRIIPIFESEYATKVNVVYGPSQSLRRQIEKGEAIDVFLPSAVEEVERLHKKGLTLHGAPRVYATTSLVLVVSANSVATPVTFRDALASSGTRIAVADPKSSVLGDVTVRALAAFDPAYKSHYRLVYAEHSHDIVTLIEKGQADVGIMYRVDAINSGQVRIIDESPADAYTPVQFGEAIVWTCRKESTDAAKEFVNFLLSPRIQKLLLQHGFESVS